MHKCVPGDCHVAALLAMTEVARSWSAWTEPDAGGKRRELFPPGRRACVGANLYRRSGEMPGLGAGEGAVYAKS